MTIRDGEERKRGFGLLEFVFATSVLATGSLAFFGAMLSSLHLAHKTKKISEANDQAMSIVEAFRQRADESFDLALNEYWSTTTGDRVLNAEAGTMSVATEVVLDETRFEPAVDLNGDGDTSDQGLLPSEAIAAYLKTTVTWDQGKEELSLVTLVARRELDIPAPGETPQWVTDPDTGELVPPPGYEADPTSGDLVPITDPYTGNASGYTEPLVMEWADTSLANGTLSFAVGAAQDENVLGMSVETTKPMYVSQIVVESQTVFSKTVSMPPTGALIVTQPFVLSQGMNTVNKISLIHMNGKKTAKLKNVTATVTFYLESGKTASVTIPAAVN